MYSEKAHRLGPPNPECISPRAVIVEYLNYADKAEILQYYRRDKVLEVKGFRLLLFADDSLKVLHKRKVFSQVCGSLYHKEVKFTLAYPTILHVQPPSGERVSFTTPQEAKSFIHSLKPVPPLETSPVCTKQHQTPVLPT